MRLLLLLACAGTPADTAPAGCDTGPGVTWESFGEGFFLTYCRSCHSVAAPDRGGAPVALDFDTNLQVAEHADRVRVRVLEEGTMPVGGGVAEDDRALLARYLECGL